MQILGPPPLKLDISYILIHFGFLAFTLILIALVCDTFPTFPIPMAAWNKSIGESRFILWMQLLLNSFVFCSGRLSLPHNVRCYNIMFNHLLFCPPFSSPPPIRVDILVFRICTNRHHYHVSVRDKDLVILFSDLINTYIVDIGK